MSVSTIDDAIHLENLTTTGVCLYRDQLMSVSTTSCNLEPLTSHGLIAHGQAYRMVFFSSLHCTRYPSWLSSVNAKLICIGLWQKMATLNHPIRNNTPQLAKDLILWTRQRVQFTWGNLRAILIASSASARAPYTCTIATKPSLIRVNPFTLSELKG